MMQIIGVSFFGVDESSNMLFGSGFCECAELVEKRLKVVGPFDPTGYRAIRFEDYCNSCNGNGFCQGIGERRAECYICNGSGFAAPWDPLVAYDGLQWFRAIWSTSGAADRDLVVAAKVI
jgi:hypothetical protein